MDKTAHAKHSSSSGLQTLITAFFFAIYSALRRAEVARCDGGGEYVI